MKPTANEEPITAEQILPHLKNQIIGRGIYCFRQIGSTNEHLRRLCRNGEEEGAVVIADRQTQGRGRHQRNWHSPPGLGLWFSVLLRPTTFLNRLGLISLLSGLAIAEAIAEQTGLSPKLKWPNDVLLNSKKVCGILAESEIKNGSADISLGVGINVNHRKKDFPESIQQLATSLYLETGAPIDRLHLLVKALQKLEKFYRLFLNGEHEKIRRNWLRLCIHNEMAVKVASGETIIEGRFQKIDENGEMLLQDASGKILKVRSGDL